MASGFAVPRVSADPVAEAMRERLYELLTPERYNRAEVEAMERKITKYLEAKNKRERIAYAALTVAGYDSDTWLEAA